MQIGGKNYLLRVIYEYIDVDALQSYCMNNLGLAEEMYRGEEQRDLRFRNKPDIPCTFLLLLLLIIGDNDGVDGGGGGGVDECFCYHAIQKSHKSSVIVPKLLSVAVAVNRFTRCTCQVKQKDGNKTERQGIFSCSAMERTLADVRLFIGAYFLHCY
jgi:hypothetical protein